MNLSLQMGQPCTNRTASTGSAGSDPVASHHVIHVSAPAPTSPSLSDASTSSLHGGTQPMRKKKKSSLWSVFSRNPWSTKKQSDGAHGCCEPATSTLNGLTLLARMEETGVSTRQDDHALRQVKSHRGVVTKKSMVNIPTCSSSHASCASSYPPPLLRHASSYGALQLPSRALQFDTDSLFSDDSEGDVGVSWITSTGRCKIGFDAEDD